MIPNSDAVPNPRTVMVEFGHADVAAGAMFGAGWSEYVAGGAVSVS